MRLYDLYRRYYSEQSPGVLAELLAETTWFREADFQEFNDTVSRLGRRLLTRGHPESMHTSGSSGLVRTFCFQPFRSTVVNFIERATKYCSDKPCVWLGWDYDPFLAKHQPTEWVVRSGRGLYHSYVFANWPASWENLVPYCESLGGNVSLVTTPNTVFNLLRRKPLVTHLLQRPGITLSSTNSEPFYPQILPVNDTTIVWSSGLNFFTCRYGNKHFLPTFTQTDGQCQNTLNLLPGLPDDDRLEVGAYLGRCGCGRDRMKISFLPHVRRLPQVGGRFLYDLSLADRLVGCYKSIQFVEVGGTVNVCFVNDDHAEDCVDEKVIREYLGDLPVAFHPNAAVPTSRENNKLATFVSVGEFDPRPWPAR